MIDTAAVPPSVQISLRRRVLDAGAWTFGGYGLSVAIRFGSNLLLTRLLVPEMFGVMSIATVVLVGLTMFSDLGLGQSVVRSERGGEPLFLNTAWALQILRGVLLSLGALVVSVLLVVANHFEFSPRGSVYADPILPYVIAVLSVSALFDAFTSTKGPEARRTLSLRRITQIEIAGQVIGLACLFAWIFFDRSIWSLVAGALAASLAKVVLSHTWLPGNPNRWQWDWAAAREIFSFGKWIFLSSILGFLVGSGDRILLGGLIGADALGVYSIAFGLFSVIDQIVGRVVSSVAFPALSEIARNRRHNLRAGYYKFHAPIAAVAYFWAGVLMTSGNALIGLLYDHRYANAGWILEVLAVGLLAVPSQIAIQGFLALGLPQIYSKILIGRLVVLVVSLPLGFYFLGLPGAVSGMVASLLVPMSALSWNARLGLIDLRRELLLLPVVVVGLGAGKLISMAVGLLQGH
jgi:O-antigen/teichoic acid export membrane protein